MQEYNSNQTWYNSQENQWNYYTEEEGSSRRKILLPVEDLSYESEVESDYDSDNDGDSVMFEKVKRNVVIDTELLESFLAESFVCKDCQQKPKLLEDKQQHHGLGTKLIFVCSEDCPRNANGYYTTTRKSRNQNIK